ncbi:cell wall protein [Diplodia corticola]|uniref:Cell wall protein n=1 Tax=Diplodia corticola TaxID=236234 RepID=A0A1J9RI42_9PEZI|nr:cell wall protein [Diplodia corticola]OJD40312.1 cell wall protein [Diplodia corticola]
MKTFALIASLAAYAAARPVPEDSTTFKLIATAPGSPIDAHYLTVSGGVFHLGKETSSTCGNIAPVFEGALAMYGDGKENQQQTYVDISGAASGALSFASPEVADMTPDQIADKFAQSADGKLTYDGGNWLACPQEVEGQYMVFAEKAYEAPKEKCTAFEIATKKVRTPKVVCVYQ